IERAVARAKEHNPVTEPSIFDFIQDVLFRRPPDFAMHFQQYSGPVQAKGLEDTAFYRYSVLLSLNEVGGNPRVFGLSTHDFHHINQTRQTRWPYAMLTTSTHDTKRGEDARMRLNALSEIPDIWEQAVHQFAELNRPYRTALGESWGPDRQDEYYFYQTAL